MDALVTRGTTETENAIDLIEGSSGRRRPPAALPAGS